MRSVQRSGGYDKVTLFFLFALALLGIVMNYAVEYPEAGHLFQLPINTHFQKQSLFAIMGAFIFLFINILDRSIWQSLAYPLYFLGLIGLLAVAFLGHTVKGSTSWFIIGGFTIQPSEMAKFGTALALAAFLSHYTTKLSRMGDRWVGITIILVPIALILLQPDAGSALVFSFFFLVLLRAGLNPLYYLYILMIILVGIFSLQYPLPYVSLSILTIGVIFLASRETQRSSWLLGAIAVMGFSSLILYQTGSWWALLPGLVFLVLVGGSLGRQNRWQIPTIIIPAMVVLVLVSVGTQIVFQEVLKPHQKERINAWLNPAEADPQGSLYNLLQSQMAIGSGGWSGKGYLKGAMTQLDYVPEQSTDFIFSTIGEEFGFLGSLVVIGLCFGLIFRVLHLAEHMRSSFGTYYAYGVASIFFFHVMVNIGMTMGLLPVIGIPLPFVSYGGSSVIAFSFMFAVLLRLHVDERN